jgi:hypothetical protein
MILQKKAVWIYEKTGVLILNQHPRFEDDEKYFTVLD